MPGGWAPEEPEPLDVFKKGKWGGFRGPVPAAVPRQGVVEACVGELRVQLHPRSPCPASVPGTWEEGTRDPPLRKTHPPLEQEPAQTQQGRVDRAAEGKPSGERWEEGSKRAWRGDGKSLRQGQEEGQRLKQGPSHKRAFVGQRWAVSKGAGESWRVWERVASSVSARGDGRHREKGRAQAGTKGGNGHGFVLEEQRGPRG